MEKKYKAILVDDESLDVENLRFSLKDFPGVSIVGVAGDASSAQALILDKRPDLLFLDMELPGMSGLELLSRLKEMVTWEMQVIFYTAYKDYLLQAVRQSAFDFLLKPYSREGFREMMERFFKHRVEAKPVPSFRESVNRLLPDTHTFMVATVVGYQILRLEQIGYFEHIKGDKQWNVVLHNQAKLQLRRNTKAEDILAYCPRFVQVNQQLIINLDYLTLIDGKFCRLDPPFDQKKDLVISRHFFKVLQEKVSLM